MEDNIMPQTIVVIRTLSACKFVEMNSQRATALKWQVNVINDNGRHNELICNADFSRH